MLFYYFTICRSLSDTQPVVVVVVPSELGVLDRISLSAQISKIEKIEVNA
jgi:hypothetical protein